MLIQVKGEKVVFKGLDHFATEQEQQELEDALLAEIDRELKQSTNGKAYCDALTLSEFIGGAFLHSRVNMMIELPNITLSLEERRLSKEELQRLPTLEEVRDTLNTLAPIFRDYTSVGNGLQAKVFSSLRSRWYLIFSDGRKYQLFHDATIPLMREAFEELEEC